MTPHKFNQRITRPARQDFPESIIRLLAWTNDSGSVLSPLAGIDSSFRGEFR